tara:strand:+ start:243 stop:443 length:201 start_codon:yes stop_codon:yes gene_type:complete
MEQFSTEKFFMSTKDKKTTLSKKQKMMNLASDVWKLDTLSQADRFYMERMLKEKCTERFLNLALRK